MTTETAGLVEYQETGNGPTIVFVPGSFSTGSSWRGITTPLSKRFRTITTSLCGYGKTQERRLPGGNFIEDEMNVLETVLTQVNAPAHVVAHSYGGFVALAFAMRRPGRMLSLTLLEPTWFDLLSQCNEPELNQEVRSLVDRYTKEWKAGNHVAVSSIIDFYGGSGTFDGYSDPVKEKLISQTASNILDWQTGFSSNLRMSEIESIQVPVHVICGSESHMAMKRSNQLLVDHLPNSDIQMLEGANHFMIGTHTEELATVIERHISG
jgi:pimeloyl-ACP methyl ester carboxylesterase